MSLLAAISIGSAVAVASANGANDNGKGMATVIGARVLSSRRALWLAHVATLAGAGLSIIVARGLMKAFQGYGLLPEDLAGQASVMAIVGISAGATVALATWLRIPISTTHALTGALVGIGLGTVGSVAWAALLAKFVIPLVFSPLISAVLAGVAYAFLHRLRLAMNVTERTCICVGQERTWIPITELAIGSTSDAATPARSTLTLHVGDESQCRQRYEGKLLGVPAAGILDAVHVLSACMTCAARGMNDAPKLAALAVGAVAWGTAGPAVAIVAAAMFFGGVVAARRVTNTMSEEITAMNAGSAATANLVSASLVILASLLVMPVSTTHVTCGALFGIGAAQRQAHWRTVRTIMLAWVATLPIAATIAALLSMAI